MKLPVLDADEYFHLALHASTVRDCHACLSYLEEVLRQQPGNARALYLRAVQHAEIGLTERAVSGLKAALEIEPSLEMARFQLGLLLLFNSNRPAEAKEYLIELTNSVDAPRGRMPRRWWRLRIGIRRLPNKSSHWVCRRSHRISRCHRSCVACSSTFQAPRAQRTTTRRSAIRYRSVPTGRLPESRAQRPCGGRASSRIE